MGVVLSLKLIPFSKNQAIVDLAGLSVWNSGKKNFGGPANKGIMNLVNILS